MSVMDNIKLRDLHAMIQEHKRLGFFASPLAQKWFKEHQKTDEWNQTLKRYGLDEPAHSLPR